MLCLLKIGHSKYILPSETGLLTVMKTMSRATEVFDKRYADEGFESLNDGLPVEVSFEMLPTYRLTKRKKKGAEVYVPEILPPVRELQPGSLRLPCRRNLLEARS